VAEVTSSRRSSCKARQRNAGKTQVASQHQSRFCLRAGTTAEPPKAASLGLRHGSCLQWRIRFHVQAPVKVCRCFSVSGHSLPVLPHIHSSVLHMNQAVVYRLPKSPAVLPMSFVLSVRKLAADGQQFHVTHSRGTRPLQAIISSLCGASCYA
jgi:hypothetical protein